MREELAPRGIVVSALHVGFMDTDMARDIPSERKIDPALAAAQALEGVEKAAPEILADDITRLIKQNLSAPAATA